MSADEIKAIVKQIDDGLKIAEKQMLEEKAARGESIIVYSEEKNIHSIPARDILAADSCSYH